MPREDKPASLPQQGNNSSSSDRLNRTLTLHIPNSHPRATSPRNSPIGSPRMGGQRSLPSHPQSTNKTYDSTSEVQDPTEAVAHERAPQVDQVSEGISERTWRHYFHSEITSGESSRDFLGE